MLALEFGALGRGEFADVHTLAQDGQFSGGMAELDAGPPAGQAPAAQGRQGGPQAGPGGAEGAVLFGSRAAGLDLGPEVSLEQGRLAVQVQAATPGTSMITKV